MKILEGFTAYFVCSFILGFILGMILMAWDWNRATYLWIKDGYEKAMKELKKND